MRGIRRRALAFPLLVAAIVGVGSAGRVHAGDPPRAAPSATSRPVSTSGVAPTASATGATSASPSPSGSTGVAPSGTDSAVVPPPQVGQNAQVSATAEALFNEGRDLIKAKDYAHACPKLAESLRIDPAIGTMLYLGDCYEKNGQTASAWAMFSDAAAAAKTAGQGERAVKAKLRVEKLSSRLVKLSLSPDPLDAKAEGLVVQRDGLTIGSALFATSVPVDPGDHTITVTATGKKPWSGVVTVAGKAGTAVTFVAPRLEDLPPPPVPEPTVTAVATVPPPVVTVVVTKTVTLPPSTTVTAPPLPTTRPDSSTQTIGFVVGSLGVAGVALGIGMGLGAKSKNDEALGKYCSANFCTDQRGIDLTNDAKTLALGSTVAFILGGVALATGGALVLYSAITKKPAAAAVMGPRTQVVLLPGSLAVRGQF